MKRAAALLLLAFGAQAEECGVSGTRALDPFKGTWRSEQGEVEVFGRGSLSYQRPDRAKPARLRVVPSGSSKENDEVALDCRILDEVGIAGLTAELEDYAAMMKGGPGYAGEMDDIALVRALMSHPPYPLVVATYYEGLSYYIRISKTDLVVVETGEAHLNAVKYKRD